MEGKDFYAALAAIQAELKAPKDMSNNFGGYRYRSAENILAAVKPLLAKHGLTINLTDTIMQIGDRYYLRAKAELSDGTNGCFSEAYAREPLAKKGMDESQVTGSASSYARKYALCGLFGIDDSSADPDNPDNHPDNPATQRREARIKASAQRGIDAAKADKTKAQAELTDAEVKAAVDACNTHDDLKAAWNKLHPRMSPAQAVIFTNRKNAISAAIAEKEIEAVL